MKTKINLAALIACLSCLPAFAGAHVVNHCEPPPAPCGIFARMLHAWPGYAGRDIRAIPVLPFAQPCLAPSVARRVIVLPAPGYAVQPAPEQARELLTLLKPSLDGATARP